MAKTTHDPNVKYTYATAFCPKCKITCFYPPGREHLPPACDGILIDISEKTE